MGRRKLILLVFLILFFGSISKDSTIHAEEQKEDTTKEEHKDNMNSSGCEAYYNEKDRKACLADRKAATKTADFYTQAILSIDPNIAKQELNEDYIKNFNNSTVTALPYDIYLADPETILMHIVNVINTILEKIGGVLTLFVLMLYNIASSSFWMMILNNIFKSLDGILFDWDNPNSYFYKLLFLFAFVAVAKRLATQRNRMMGIKGIINTFVGVAISCMMIVFISQYGRPLIMYVERLATDSIVGTFSFSDEDITVPVEIKNKKLIFDTMQRQGFVLRHFGVVDENRIPNENDGSYDMSDKGSKIASTGAERVQKLLDDPSKENAQIERQEYGNSQIGYNQNQIFNITGMSIIFGLHRILIGGLFGAGSLVLILIGFAKEILLAVSIYALVFTLLSENKRIAANWFSSRIQWTLLFIVSYVAFSIMLYFTNSLIKAVTQYGMLWMLVFDLILLILMIQAYKNKEKIWQSITADIAMDGDSVIDVAKGVVTGDFSPSDIYNDRKRRKESEKQDELDNEYDKSTKSKQSSIADVDDNYVDSDSAEIDTTDETMTESNGENKDVSVTDTISNQEKDEKEITELLDDMENSKKLKPEIETSNEVLDEDSYYDEPLESNEYSKKDEEMNPMNEQQVNTDSGIQEVDDTKEIEEIQQDDSKASKKHKDLTNIANDTEENNTQDRDEIDKEMDLFMENISTTNEMFEDEDEDSTTLDEDNSYEENN